MAIFVAVPFLGIPHYSPLPTHPILTWKPPVPDGPLNPPKVDPPKPHSPTWKEANDFIMHIGIAAATIFVFVVVVTLALKCIGNWGWWLPTRPTSSGRHHEHAGTSRMRQQYVKTWHGWVPIEQYHRKNDRPPRKRQRGWDKTQFEKVWWDPSKPNPEPDYKVPILWRDVLPKRLRSRKHRDKADLESGIFRLRSYGPKRPTSKQKVFPLSGFVSELPIKPLPAVRRDTAKNSLNLARLRKYPSKVLRNRVVKPPCDFNRPALAQLARDGKEPWPTLPVSDFPPQIDGVHTSQRPIRFSEPDDEESGKPVQLASIFRSTLSKRAQISRKARKSGAKTVRLKHLDLSVSSLRRMQMKRRRGYGFQHRPQVSQGPFAPDNTVDTCSHVRDTNTFEVRGSTLNMSSSEIQVNHANGARPADYDLAFANSLERRLDVWAKPFYIDPFPQTTDVQGTNLAPFQSGITGRRGSPVMTLRIAADVLSPYPEDFSLPINNEELMESFANQISSAQIDNHREFPAGSSLHPMGYDGVSDLPELPRRPSLEVPKFLLKVTEPSSVEEKSVGQTRHRMSILNRRSKSYHLPGDMETMNSVRVSSTKLPRRGSLPTITIPEAATGGPDSSLKNQVLTSAERKPVVGNTSSAQRSHILTVAERKFLETLNRKLAWMEFELSPGFRGPTDNPSLNQGVNGHGALNPVSRAPESKKRRALNSDIGPNEVLVLRREKENEEMRKKLEVWRIDINRHRDVQQLEGLEDNFDKALARPIFRPFEVFDGDIDTAAFVLPRTPCFATDCRDKDSSIQPANKALFKLRDYNGWERIRRPENVQRAKMKGKVLGKSHGLLYYHRPESILRLRDWEARSRQNTQRLRALSLSLQRVAARAVPGLSSIASLRRNISHSVGSLRSWRRGMSSNSVILDRDRVNDDQERGGGSVIQMPRETQIQEPNFGSGTHLHPRSAQFARVSRTRRPNVIGAFSVSGDPANQGRGQDGNQLGNRY